MKNTYIRRNKTAISGFTLIEILIVVAMLGIMLTATYAPYSHYQKKALLKQGVKEITQSVYEARNLAINGLDVSDKNVSVGLYFDTSDNLRNHLTYFSYPHETDQANLGDPRLLPDTSIIKKKDLPNSIWLEEIQSQNTFLFLYDAISGEGRYYQGDGAGLTEITDPQVEISISYKGATTPTLQSDITYYTETYIADY